MNVIEVFKSIQGEGLYMGVPTTFVRMGGCNLNCSWCDTKYSWDDTKFIEYGVQELVDEIINCTGTCNIICLTGGEPLVQQDELGQVAAILSIGGYKVHIETNGTIKPNSMMANNVNFWSVSPKLEYIASDEFTDEFMSVYLHGTMMLKFVVGARSDVVKVMKFLTPLEKTTYKGSHIPYPIVIQPERYAATQSIRKLPDGEVISIDIEKTTYLHHMVDVVEWCQEELIHCNWRVLPQLHYLLYGSQRGI